MGQIWFFSARSSGAAVLLSLVLLWGAAAAQAAFGELRVLKGKAVVFRGRAEIHVVDRLTLEHGDRVETRKGGKVHIIPAGPLKGAEAIATSNTRLVVSDLRRRRKRSPFRLLFGAIRSRLRAYAGKAPFLRTATATIGVKGTDFIVYVKRKNASEFIGVTGLIEATSVSRPEYALRIGKRQWGEIVEGVKPKPPVRVPDDDWEQALREFSFPAG